MSSHLATYLNDHLAGSTTALELLKNLATAYASSEIAHLALALKEEVTQDRQQLEALMEKLHIPRQLSRRSSAWLTEKLTQLKFRYDDPAAGAFRLLESIDAISLGVEGKRLLWLALATAAESNPALQGPDYTRLQQRAQDQRQRLETARLDAAATALAATSKS